VDRREKSTHRYKHGAEAKTHHHVAVDIFDDKVAYIIYCDISTIFIQRPGRAITQLHWRPVNLWN
jgi:hypothetical protein